MKGNIMEKEAPKRPVWVCSIDWVNELSGKLSGIALFAAAIIIVESVTVRYIFRSPTGWQIEMSGFLLIFVIFVGGAYGLKHGSHVGVDLLILKLPDRAAKYLSLFTAFGAMAVVIVTGYRGWYMWWEATINGWHSGSLWAPPLYVPYILMPLGMTLIFLQYLVVIYDIIISLQ